MATEDGYVRRLRNGGQAIKYKGIVWRAKENQGDVGKVILKFE